MHAPNLSSTASLPYAPSANGVVGADDSDHALSTFADPRTVLFVDQSGELGGAEFALLPLAHACAARAEVLLLSDGAFRERLEALGVRVKLARNTRVSNISKEALRLSVFATLPAIAKQVRAVAVLAREYDVVFANTQKALALIALGKLLHRRPVVWYLHDIVTRDHFGRAQLAIIKWLCRLAVDKVVANSHASAQALAALTGRAPESIGVVHNGIDTQAFIRIDATRRASLREQLALDEDTRVAGLFGRLASWKGQHVAIDALTRLPGLHLVLVGAPLYGEEPYAQSLIDQARRLGVEERVHFAGFRDDVPAWMQAMDVILHTSTEPEPFGRVIVEGMAAGRPVIASAAGGVKEIVRHEENGLLVAPGDPQALADAIGRVLADPALAQRLADQGPLDVERHFSLAAYLDQMTRAIASARR